MHSWRLVVACLWLSVFTGLSGCAHTGARWLNPLSSVEQSLVFQPVKYPAGEWDVDDFERSDAWFTSSDGVKLHGWYVPHQNPAGVALFCHGNAGNITFMAESIRVLHDEHRLSVLAFDYRGYGRSSGVPSEEGIVLDARAARLWLARREGIREQDVILLGHSLGGGVAVELAAEDGARGLVLASTFTSLPDVAEWHAPWLPASELMTNRLNSVERLREYGGPVLIVHGDADSVIPLEQGKRLFAVAPGPKRLIVNPGGDHIDELSKEYRKAFESFLKALPAEAGRITKIERPTKSSNITNRSDDGKEPADDAVASQPADADSPRAVGNKQRSAKRDKNRLPAVI